MAGESNIQSKVVLWARSQDIIGRKLTWGEGWPDYMFLYKGHVCFIEFKDFGKTLKKLQEYIVEDLRVRGFLVGVIDNVSDGMTFLQHWKDYVENCRKYLEDLR